MPPSSPTKNEERRTAVRSAALPLSYLSSNVEQRIAPQLIRLFNVRRSAFKVGRSYFMLQAPCLLPPPPGPS